MNEKRYLFLMLGVPGSGKSVFSQQLAHTFPAVYLNSDRFREAIFRNKVDKSYNPAGHAKVFGAMTEALAQALAVNSVVFDANNNRYSQRKEKAKLASKLNAETVVVYVKAPIEVAIERAANRPIGGHSVLVAEDIVRRMARELDEPQTEEQSIVIDGTISFDEQWSAFQQQWSKLHGNTKV